jgi:hypothetical protein
MKKILAIIASFVCIMIATAFQGGQSIIINDNGSVLEIRYAGKFMLNEDETAISQISPDGFINFRKNDTRFTAQPGDQGQVFYRFSEKNRKVSDEKGKKILGEAIREMIAHGMFAGERAERLYRKGGVQAVLNDLSGKMSDGAKASYFNWLFGNNSLTASEITEALKKVGILIHSDMSKGNAVRNLSQRALTNEQFNLLMGFTGSIGSDMEKGNVLKRMIDEKMRTEEQWISLINQTGKINSGMEKSEVLSQIAQKMPAGENTRTAYVSNAKTLKGLDYEKAMKALR